MKVDLAYERDDDNYDGDGRNDAVHPPVAVTLAKSRSVPVLFVNGRAIPPAIASLARPGQTLLDYLRNVLKLCGTKLGCGEGGCGACTVLISTFRTASGGGGGSRSGIVHAAVNACLYPALAADGKHVTTIEGVGSWKSGRARRAAAESCTGDDDDDLHPIQRALADGHGSQCGFCTPGIVMALYGALSGEDNDGGGGCGGGPPVHASELEERMDGNLCRCTGYRPIWDAARGLCRDGDGGTPDVEDLLAVGPVGSCGTPCRECPDRDDCVEECNVVDDDDIPPSYATPPMSSPMVVCTTESNMRELRAKRSEVERKWWTQPYEMFPDDLLPRKRRSDGDHGDGDEDGRRAGGVREFLARPLVVADATVHDGGTWFQPTTLVELLDLYRAYGRTGDGDGGGIKMVVGNTEVGIETKFKRMVYPRMVHPAVTIRSLYEIFLSGPSLVVGGCASLSDLQTFCHDLMMTAKDRDGGGVDANLFRTAMPTHDMLRWFASTQIRNVACLGGNLVTASPISDMNPLLCSHGASIVLASRPRADGGIERRRVDVSDFFLGYRRVDIAEIEVVERVEIPLVRSMFEYVAPFKQVR
jgi:xanthine dehydrogenase/oxidase